jgi:anti-sigma factor RsiW
MKSCSFEKLVRYLDKQLKLDEKLELLEHLDDCEVCREAIYQISRDRDAELFVYRDYNADRVAAL